MMILTLQRLQCYKAFFFNSKGYGAKNPTFYVLDLVCSLMISSYYQNIYRQILSLIVNKV